MTKQQFIDWARSKGWAEDNFGHLRKDIRIDEEILKYRFKLSSTLARHEIQITMPDGKHEWLRRKSNYYKYLSITPDGKLSGMKR